jgi:hypothetical protein
VVYF